MGQGTVILAVVALVLLGVGAWWWTRVRRAGDSVESANHGRVEPTADLPRDYSPKNVGNDASARPWESSPSIFGEMESSRDVEGPLGRLMLPAGFDVEDFLRSSKENFVRLQAAWDRADTSTLRALMTPEMSEQLQTQLNQRETVGAQSGAPAEVVMLEAKLLGIEHMAQGLLASVEFAGMIREESGTGPNPFREVWSITRPEAEQGTWLVAGVQALQ